MELLLDKTLDEMNKKEIWLLYWYMENESWGQRQYEVYYDLLTQKYYVYSFIQKEQNVR